MTTAQHPTHQEPGVQSTQPSTGRLVRIGAIAGAIAAACTTVVAAIASATKAVLVGALLLAAAIILPTLSKRLTAVNNDR